MDSCQFYLNKAIKIHPDDIKSYLYMGLSLEINKEYDSALILFNKVMSLDSNMIQSYLGMSVVYLHKNDLKKSLYYFEKALSKGYSNIINIQNDTELEPLRKTPGFKVMMKKYFPNQ